MFKEMPWWKKTLYIILLLIPLAAAVAWLFLIKSAEDAVMNDFIAYLSPVNNKPLIIGLIIFMVGYVIFLFMMFHEDIAKMISKEADKKLRK